MSVCVALTDSAEGRAALEAGSAEAGRLGVDLVVVDLTTGLDPSMFAPDAPYEVVPRSSSDLDEVEQVLQVLEDRPEVTRLVVGVRRRSAIGKAVLGSIAQRLLLEAPVPVLSVKTAGA